MNWYLTKIVYQIICGDGKHTAQFDEQLRLIHAADQMEAFLKSRHIGVSEEDTFLNHVNKPVKWKFVDVAEIHLLDKLVDGAEMYSRIHEDEHGDDYIRTVKSKAAHLLETVAYHSPVLN